MGCAEKEMLNILKSIADAYVDGIILTLSQRSTSMFLPMFIAGLVLTAVVAYILGSLNFALILSKRMYGEDIREYGSKNAGTTNMMRTYGKKAALFTILGDILKGIVSVIIGSFIMGATLGGYVAGLFCMIGHVFPVFYGFRGGKGVATAAAVILVVNPLVFLVMISLFIITVLLSRYISLGSCLAAAIFPLLTFYSRVAVEEPLPFSGAAFLCSFLMALLVICKHYSNLKRLAHGKESKFSFKKSEKTLSEKQNEQNENDGTKVYTAKKKNKNKNTKYTAKKK